MMKKNRKMMGQIKKHLQGDMQLFEKEKQEDKELIKKLEGKMKRQGYKDRLDESLGERRGKESSKKQSMKDRRDESRGSDKHHKAAAKHLEKAHEALAKMHEAAAGRKYNRSEKHRAAESRGMKRAMRDR